MKESVNSSSGGSFNKPEPIEEKALSDIVRLKLELDYQQLPIMDEFLEKILEGRRGQHIGHAYRADIGEDSLRVFVLIVEECGGTLRGFHLALKKDGSFCEFDTDSFDNPVVFNRIRPVKGDIVYSRPGKRVVFIEIPFREFSKLYSACRTIIEIKNKL